MKPASWISAVFALALVGSGCAQPQRSSTPTIEITASVSVTPPAARLVVLPSATVSVAPASVTDTQSNPNNTAADAAFESLLERVKNNDPTVDFTKFRLAYAKTSQYDPYSFGLADLRSSMVTALNNKDFALALKLANDLLAHNYISPDAHAGAIRAYEGQGDSEKAGFHRHVLDSLISSILHSGDGRSPETAYVVVLIEEEYVALAALGIENHGQSEFDANGHSYDILDGLNTNTNLPVKVYFNIDIPFGALANSLTP